MTFKEIPGYEKLYVVSDKGIVRSLPRTTTSGKKIAFRFEKNGYVRVCLWKEGKRKFFLVHRLVAECFIPNPDNKPFINHKDGDKKNNKKSNLEWNTQSENERHAFNTGLKKGLSGEENPNSKFTIQDIEKIKKLRLEDNMSYPKIAAMFNTCHSHIQGIVKGKRWNKVLG